MSLLSFLRNSPSIVVIMIVFAVTSATLGPWSLPITVSTVLLLYGPWRDRLEDRAARKGRDDRNGQAAS